MKENRKIEPTQKLDSIVHRVIGAAIQVHRFLGPGFLENLYEEALCIELNESKIKFVRQIAMQVTYRGHVVGQSRLDLLIEKELIVELKAVECLNQIHVAQLISYLKATGYSLGLLINFNVPRLKQGIKRVIVS